MSRHPHSPSAKFVGVIDEALSNSAWATVEGVGVDGRRTPQMRAHIGRKHFAPGEWQHVANGSYVSLPKKRGGAWMVVRTPRWTERDIRRAKARAKRTARLFRQEVAA